MFATHSSPSGLWYDFGSQHHRMVGWITQVNVFTNAHYFGFIIWQEGKNRHKLRIQLNLRDLCKEPKPSKKPMDREVGAHEVKQKSPMALLAVQPKIQTDLADRKAWFAAPRDDDFCETKETLTRVSFQNYMGVLKHFQKTLQPSIYTLREPIPHIF